jgi:hypothetical protein
MSTEGSFLEELPAPVRSDERPLAVADSVPHSDTYCRRDFSAFELSSLTKIDLYGSVLPAGLPRAECCLFEATGEELRLLSEVLAM